jgi:Ca-activated chloride channel homolog
MKAGAGSRVVTHGKHHSKARRESMKVKTVALLAALGMTLTSWTVWSVTDPRSDVDVVEPDEPGPPAIATSSDDPAFAGAQFTAGQTLMLEGRLGHSRLLADRENESFLFVNVSAEQAAAAATSRPLNLAVVLDRSGSMKGQGLENARAAASGMVQRLREGDVVSVVTYNSLTQIVVPPTTIDPSSRQRVIAALDGITAQGDTCISCGIDAGIELLRQRSGMVDRLLLLSDGEATTGVRDVEGFRRIAAGARRLGAAISSIGVDVDYNERIMAAVAQESNGRHYFVERPSELAKIFDDELASLVKTIGKSAELAVDLGPGVAVEQVLDRTFRREGNRLIVPLGDFAAGEQKTLLAKLRIPRGAAGDRPVADVRLSYDDLSASRKGECEGRLSVQLTRDANQISTLDPLVLARVQRSETASVLTEANQLFAQGEVEQARRKLSKKLDDLRGGRSAAVSAAPKSRAGEVDKDFQRQEAALGAASGGFASPPAGAAPARPQESREGKAQVRANQKSAVDLAF